MDATIIRQRPFDATPKLRGSSSSNTALNASKPRVTEAESGDKDIIAPDPAALRARLKHRGPPPPTGSSGSNSNNNNNADYNNVLDTARRLAVLEHQRAQDAAYIRTLEHTRATLQRDAQTTVSTTADAAAAAARARAEAEAEAEQREEALRVRADAERAAVVARVEQAEERARALERMLREARERVRVLEGVVEGERRRREEWERGLEALALGGGGGAV